MRGCGCEKGLIRGLRPPYAKLFHPACYEHDADYERGGGKEDRRCADRALYLNMLSIADKRKGRPYAHWRLVSVALLYYTAVRAFGWHYFNYDHVTDM